MLLVNEKFDGMGMITRIEVAEVRFYQYIYENDYLNR